MLVVLFSMLITAGYVRGAVDMLQLPFFSLLLFVRSLLFDVVLEIEEQRNLFMDPYVDILDLFFGFLLYPSQYSTTTIPTAP